jgi:hypothetical protein
MATSPKPVLRPTRRRQRSVRVTVAVVLLSCATLAVVAALPTGSFAWMAAASVLALSCAWASARIIYTELAQSRRESARDRAAQAQAYQVMFSERAEEHAEFTTAVTDKIARSEREVRELTATIVLAERRVAEAESRVQREARRAQELETSVAALTEELAARQAEEDAELAGWDPANLELARQFRLPGMGEDGYDDTYGDLDTVVDLLAWEEKVAQATAPAEAEKKHA